MNIIGLDRIQTVRDVCYDVKWALTYQILGPDARAARSGAAVGTFGDPLI